MVGKTNVAGARLRAVIAVTYPVGSVCTCVSGTKTLKARDTSGKALFNVSVGEWTVSCTDGTDTASMTVSITHKEQAECVELNYNFYLYKSGDQMTEITGGWKPHYSNGDGASFGANKISIWGKAQTYTGTVQTVKKIDFSKFRELSVICIAPTNNLVVRLSTYKTTESFRNENIASASNVNPGTTSIDLSNINSSGYVALYSDGSATVTEVYLK